VLLPETNPPFMSRSKKIIAKSSQRPSIAERMAATSIIQGMVPQKLPRNFISGLIFFSKISLGPYYWSLASASEVERPLPLEESLFIKSATYAILASSAPMIESKPMPSSNI
jgi:hypothetical protein